MALFISDQNKNLIKVAGNYKNIENGELARKDASNLSSANITSWKSALSIKDAELLYNQAGSPNIYGLYKNVDDFRFLQFICYYTYSGNTYYFEQTVPVSFFKGTTNTDSILVSSGGHWVSLGFPTNPNYQEGWHFHVYATNDAFITRVYGIY